MNMRQIIERAEIRESSSGNFEDDESKVPELNRLTLTNIFRDIDLANGKRPSVHKADFAPGEYIEFRKNGRFKP